MANTITFTAGTTSTTITPVTGSVRAGGGHDDRGGGTIPGVRAGFAMNGSCQAVVVQTTSTGKQQTLAELLALVSEVGPGQYTVTGSGLYADIKSYDALVDVSIGGDSVQTADIAWKGTYQEPEPETEED